MSLPPSPGVMSDIGVLEIFRTRVFWNSWNNILSYKEKGETNDGREQGMAVKGISMAMGWHIPEKNVSVSFEIE